MSMLDNVIARIERLNNLSDQEKHIIKLALFATIAELGPIIQATWEDEYPPELKDYMIKGRKLFRKKRLVERLLGALPATRISTTADFVASCGLME